MMYRCYNSPNQVADQVKLMSYKKCSCWTMVNTVSCPEDRQIHTFMLFDLFLYEKKNALIIKIYLK